MSDENKENDGTAMTKTDAKECRSLVKNEYTFLNDELSGQAGRIKSDVRDAIDKETEQLLKNARKRVETLRSKAEQVNEFAREQMAAVRKKAEAVEAAGRKLEEELREQGIEFNYSYRESEPVSFSGHDSDNPINFNLVKNLTHVGQQNRLEKAMAIVNEQVNDARRGLKVQENEAVRKLTMNMMTSEEAKSFIANIPTLEALIEKPDLKQIEA